MRAQVTGARAWRPRWSAGGAVTKYHTLGSFNKTSFSLTVLGAWTAKIEGPPSVFLVRAPPGLQMATFYVYPQQRDGERKRALCGVFDKEIYFIISGPYIYHLINLRYRHMDPTSKYTHVGGEGCG